MTKKNMTKEFEEAKLNTDPMVMFYALKAFAEIGIDGFQDEHGLYLNKAERQARGKQPLKTGDAEIKIEMGGGAFTIKADDPDLPMVSIPVGLSDKVTTATIPWQKIAGVLFQELISVFGGDTEYAMTTVKDRINAYIDGGIEETDEGRLKINQSKLPEVRNADEVALFLNSLKRQFKSKSRGTPVLNLSVVCPQPPTEVLQQTFPAPNTDFNSVFQIPDTDCEYLAIDPSDEVTTREASPSVSVSPPVASGETEVASVVNATSTLISRREQVAATVKEALGDEKRTIGYLKKAIYLEEEVWRAILESMITTGEVCKEGERRSCRYFLPGVVQ